MDFLDVFQKSKWIEKIARNFIPFFVFVEERFGISTMTILGIPVIVIAAMFVYPYFKNKKRKRGFEFYRSLVCLIMFTFFVLAFQIGFTFYGKYRLETK
jgi:MFS superfamily sulfate permease-like transporter